MLVLLLCLTDVAILHDKLPMGQLTKLINTSHGSCHLLEVLDYVPTGKESPLLVNGFLIFVSLKNTFYLIFCGFCLFVF